MWTELLPPVTGWAMGYAFKTLLSPRKPPAIELANTLANCMEAHNAALARLQGSEFVPEWVKTVTAALSTACYDPDSAAEIVEKIKEIEVQHATLSAEAFRRHAAAKAIVPDEIGRQIWTECIFTGLDVASVQALGRPLASRTLLAAFASEPTGAWHDLLKLVRARARVRPPAHPFPESSVLA